MSCVFGRDGQTVISTEIIPFNWDFVGGFFVKGVIDFYLEFHLLADYTAEFDDFLHRLTFDYYTHGVPDEFVRVIFFLEGDLSCVDPSD